MTLPVYIIAGEPSGDRLGGALMAALSDLTEVSFNGVGGRDMQGAGLGSLFPMSDLTVMGLGEVLPRLPLILRRIRETAEDIVARAPSVLITIDAPDFCLRVAKRVRRELPDLKIIHYVAPSVWAWRPGRAAKMARHVDHVLALLPFEPPYMEAAGMTCDFVGHPVAARSIPDAGEIAAFRERHGIPAASRLLLLAPGSRRGEVKRIGGDLLEVVKLLRAGNKDLQVLCPLAETVREDVQELLRSHDLPAIQILPEDGEDEKFLAFAAADAALCTSGTVTLEIAAAGTPMVAAYRTTWLTAQIVRRAVRVNTANLINLISGQSVVPEFLQEFCQPRVLADEVTRLLAGGSEADRQRDVFNDVMQAMGRGGMPPGERAARSVLSVIRGERQLSGSQMQIPAAAPGPGTRNLGRRG